MTHKILHNNSLKKSFFILYLVTGKIRKKIPVQWPKLADRVLP